MEHIVLACITEIRIHLGTGYNPRAHAALPRAPVETWSAV
jgi:hypothetical protein